jgi:hypothetical protein
MLKKNTDTAEVNYEFDCHDTCLYPKDNTVSNDQKHDEILDLCVCKNIL